MQMQEGLFHAKEQRSKGFREGLFHANAGRFISRKGAKMQSFS
jgi:hypothetical protein